MEEEEEGEMNQTGTCNRCFRWKVLLVSVGWGLRSGNSRPLEEKKSSTY